MLLVFGQMRPSKHRTENFWIVAPQNVDFCLEAYLLGACRCGPPFPNMTWNSCHGGRCSSHLSFVRKTRATLRNCPNPFSWLPGQISSIKSQHTSK